MIFGHQNDTSQAADTTNTFNPTTPAPVAPDPTFQQNPLAVDPATGVSLPTAPVDAFDELAAEPTTYQQPYIQPTPQQPAYTSAPSFAAPDPTPAYTIDPAPTTSPTSQPVSDDLLALKQHALAELSPLVDHLDQTPEERFKTTMMMIQATDNQSLIPHAYEAAQAINDEKARAQALLDLVNEINYFTHPKEQQ